MGKMMSQTSNTSIADCWVTNGRLAQLNRRRAMVMLVIHFMIVSLSAKSDSSANLQEPRRVTISTGLLTCIFNKISKWSIWCRNYAKLSASCNKSSIVTLAAILDFQYKVLHQIDTAIINLLPPCITNILMSSEGFRLADGTPWKHIALVVPQIESSKEEVRNQSVNSEFS